MWPFSSSPLSLDTSASTSTPTTAPRALTNAEAINPATNPLNPQGLKPCCACPETKKLRDDCFLQYGSNADPGSESEQQCKDIVRDHLACMRGLGFNV